MKTNPKTRKTIAASLMLAVFSILDSQRSAALAQGSLTPPGPPALTMKSLDEIYAAVAGLATSEQRAPITSLPITITQQGCYYLTHSVDINSGLGIDIAAANVTVDLNGFSIRSFDSSNDGVGIRIDPAFHNITIRNGHIAGSSLTNGNYMTPGFGYGIYASGTPRNVRVSGVTVAGCRYDGINIGMDSTVVESCTVRTVGGNGIVASVVKNSVALDCGLTGISAITVSDCWGQSSVSGDGICADAYLAQNCRGESNSGTGVASYAAQNCYGYSSSGRGINADVAQNCYGRSGGGGDGLYATVAQNCFGYSYTGYGLEVYRIAVGCYGYSDYGIGLYALDAAFCVGRCSTGTNKAIQATIANGCYAVTGTTSITYKYNMP